MIFAVIGDLDGDLAALEAVIRAVDGAGLLTLLHTGNCVCGGADGAAVLDLLRQRDVLFVAGHRDRAVSHFQKKQGTLARKLSSDEFAAVADAHHALPSAALEYLAGIPREARTTLEGVEVVLCHGALSSKRGIITAESPLQNLEREREIAPVEIIVTGGAPAPFHRVVGDTHFVCPGPVHAGEQTVRYAVVDTEERPFTVSFPEVRLP